MLFGNASWGFREAPLKKQLKITKKMGLSILELGIANAPKDIPLTATDKQLLKVKKLYAKYNVVPLCAATGNDFTCGNDNDVEKVKRVIDMCEIIGVKYLRIFAGFTPIDEVTGDKWDNMIKCLKEVYAYSKNVILTVETHGGVNGFDDGVEHFNSVTTDADSILKISKAVKGLKLNYDPANIYAVGKNPAEFYDKISKLVETVHLKDFKPVESGHILPSACGESDMKWEEILLKIKDKNYPMLFEYENTCDVEIGLNKCLNYISKEIKKI